MERNESDANRIAELESKNAALMACSLWDGAMLQEIMPKLMCRKASDTNRIAELESVPSDNSRLEEPAQKKRRMGVGCSGHEERSCRGVQLVAGRDTADLHRPYDEGRAWPCI